MGSSKQNLVTTIREAAGADAGVWSSMRHALWPSADREELEAEVAPFLRNSDLRCFVAEDGEKNLIGFIEVSLRSVADGCDSSPVGYIEGWYVEEKFRGRGVGEKLVKKGEAWARSRGCTEMASDAEIDNPGSIAAHRKLGFQEVSRVVTFRKFIR